MYEWGSDFELLSISLLAREVFPLPLKFTLDLILFNIINIHNK